MLTDREIFDLRISKQYYIDTYGKIHKCKVEFNGRNKDISIHYEIAKALYPKIEYPKDYLYEIGWLAIGSYTGKICKYKPNQAQINTIDELDRS